MAMTRSGPAALAAALLLAGAAKAPARAGGPVRQPVPGPQRAISGVLRPGPVVHARTGPPTAAPGRTPLPARSGLREQEVPGTGQVRVPDLSPRLGAPLPGPGRAAGPAPGDPRRLTVFRDTTVPITTGKSKPIAEPSTDQLGRDIFATGNKHAEFSRDNGRTWRGLNPYTVFGPNFCCDQVTVADPRYHRQDWVLQYIPFYWGRPGGGHLVLADSPAGDFTHWRPYVIRPADFGYSDQQNLDYNDLVAGRRFLYLTTRIIHIFPDGHYRVVAAALMRVSRADLAAGRPAHYDAITRTDITEEMRVPQGITDVAYAAATSLRSGEGRRLRLLVWPEWSRWVTTVDRRVPPFRYMSNASAADRGDCGSRDHVVADWCTYFSSGAVFAARGRGALWFAWAARQYGTRRPFPYIRITVVRTPGLRVVRSHDLYSRTVAYAYQAIAPDRRGHVALIAAYGGGTGAAHYYPGAMIAVSDDVSPLSPTVAYVLPGRGNACSYDPDAPYQGTWGDYLTIRSWHSGAGVWLATAFARASATPVTCDAVVPMTIKNIVFGRERDRRSYERAVRPRGCPPADRSGPCPRAAAPIRPHPPLPHP